MGILLANLSFCVCILGLLLFVFARPEYTKTRRVGEIMFGAGLLAFLMAGVRHP